MFRPRCVPWAKWIARTTPSCRSDPVRKDRRRPLLRLLERGVISSDVDLELAADLVVGPIAVALYAKGAKLHPRIVGPMVEMAVCGIKRAGAETSG
ncbi:MAG: hypothetical protein GY725_18980 [bacterium]|nr:hypothetical protein [bacterium]